MNDGNSDTVSNYRYRYPLGDNGVQWFSNPVCMVKEE